uniref:RHS repeat domain-containing protein n=1 Tax=Zhouia sp. PK063 TaxID=3373602 RepID=UPI0037DDA8F3
MWNTRYNLATTGSSNYYPFGMVMPGMQDKQDKQENYRYAYQGQEKDEETGKEAFEHRLWDARINRWLSPDIAKQFHSPYVGMGNNPKYRDMKGDSIFVYSDGLQFGKYSIDHLLTIVKSTSIGHYALETFHNNPSRHLHISIADLTGIKHKNGKGYGANGVTYTSNRRSWFKGEELTAQNIEKTYGIKKTDVNPLYFEGIKFRNGRNQIIFLEQNSSNTEAKQAQTLFHEIKAHAVDFQRSDQHYYFSGDPNGHFNPATMRPPYIPEAFPLNLFLMQMQFNKTPSTNPPPCGCPNLDEL